MDPRIAKLFYGTNETQESERGEANLKHHFTNCAKDPGHDKFIPVSRFTLNDLPEGYRDNDVFEWIKATSDLTVRVSVDLISPFRQEFWPESTFPYPFHDKRGHDDVTRSGTGRVWRLYKYTEKDRRGACTCQECQRLARSNSVWWEVWMYTAAHVVFDETEAARTSCRLFFDSEDSILVTLVGWRVAERDFREDRCLLKCVTCDVKLMEKLDAMWWRWLHLWLRVNDKYKSSGNVGRFNFLVSHPHGCSKQISIGQWKDRVVAWEGSERLKYTMYTYTTSTCPGSSGACVHSLRFVVGWLFDHIHSGVNSEGSKFCGTGGEFPHLD